MVGCDEMTRTIAKLFAFSALSFLSACGGNTDYEQLAKVIYDQVRSDVGDDSVPRAKAAAVPYATLGARIGGNAESMMVLSTVSGMDRLWLDAARAGITTRNGRIVRTVGLGHNLDGFQIVNDTVVSATTSANGTSRHYLYDFWDKRVFGLSVVCSETEAGMETIRIIGVHHATRHTIESCRAAQMDWSFKNEFWSDPNSGYVWKSRQHIHPDLSPLTLEVLRPDQG
jgi:hypothetical protein